MGLAVHCPWPRAGVLAYVLITQPPAPRLPRSPRADLGEEMLRNVTEKREHGVTGAVRSVRKRSGI